MTQLVLPFWTDDGAKWILAVDTANWAAEEYNPGLARQLFDSLKREAFPGLCTEYLFHKEASDGSGFRAEGSARPPLSAA